MEGGKGAHLCVFQWLFAVVVPRARKKASIPPNLPRHFRVRGKKSCAPSILPEKEEKLKRLLTTLISDVKFP